MIDENRPEERLRIGKITVPHGLKGHVKVTVITDIESRFSEGNVVLLEKGSDMVEYRIESFQLHKPRLGILKLEGVDSRDDSESVAGMELFIPKSEAEKDRSRLSENEFYYFDLIGMPVYLDGSEYGVISDIVENGSGHILDFKDVP